MHQVRVLSDRVSPASAPRVPAPALNHTLFKQLGSITLTEASVGVATLGITALGQGSMDYFWFSGLGHRMGFRSGTLLGFGQSCPVRKIKKHTLQAKPFCNISFCHSVPERRTWKSVSPQEVFEKSPTPQADALSGDCHITFS